MGDDTETGRVTDCRLRLFFPTIRDILSSADLHHGKNVNKRDRFLCHHPLITQLT